MDKGLRVILKGGRADEHYDPVENRGIWLWDDTLYIRVGRYVHEHPMKDVERVEFYNVVTKDD